MIRSAKSPSKSKSTTSTTVTVTTLQRLTKTAKRAQSAGKIAHRARCEELLSLIARRKTEVVEAFYDIGEALREIERKELFRALGHSSFVQMLSKRAVMSATQARKLMKIVENVPRNLALELGQERAFGLVMYTEATAEKDTVETVVKANAKIAGVSAKKASKRTIEQESKRLREARPKTAMQRKEAKEHAVLEKRLLALLKTNGVRSVELDRRPSGVALVLTYVQLSKLPA